MSGERPRISVLMPVRNGGAFVEEAVASIRGQTERRWELLIMDDGSTDDTAGRLARLAAADGRIRVEHGENLGLSRACNQLARSARGDYLARMDADDVAAPERFARQLAWMEAHPETVALGGQAVRIDPEGWPIDRWRAPLRHEEIERQHLRGFGGGIIHPTAFIRREVFEQVGGYDEDFEASQDYDLWLRLAEVGRLANLPEVVLFYRLHASSITCSRRLVQARCIREAHARAVRRRGLNPPPACELQVRSELTPRRARMQWVKFALRSGHHATAWKHARALWAEKRDGLTLALLAVSWLACRWAPGPAGPVTREGALAVLREETEAAAETKP
ncbi:MAG: glycosyltransferase [Verrucomicrobia bacterium]|nr:MAG: glycosyltransferase [Verrucomicrobiota bacterium]